LNDIEIGGRRLKMSVLHDVTPQRALEQQLRQAQKMEAVGRLAGGVAHDFNNLLTVVLGHTELALAMLDGSHAVRSGLLEVQKAGSRAATLTNQLLVFSRKHVLDPKVVDVNAVVESTTRMLRRVIGEDVRVHVDLASPLHLVKADAGQIEQVVMNLAINARDAMPKGGDLTIRTRNVDVDADFAAHRVGMAPGPYVLLSMQDVGIGMTAEVRAHLFEPFFTTKEPGKGTGLGLSTVYAIVKQWGGTIWLESEAGRGTVFDIYFPCTRERETARSSEATMRALARGEETVLLVEDEEMVRDLAKEILTLRGYDVLPAASAESALELAAGLGKVDLVLTDLVMPGLNGRELTDRLRARWPELNVLYMSGYSENVLENRELPAGARFIQKPFSGPALAAKVREVLDLRP
jgi:nitrogen-specific signal transduction histidine kinase